jgi:TonB-dependent receptor
MINKVISELTSRHVLLGTCCLAGFAATFTVPATAQEQQGQQNTEQSDATTLDEVVVTGFRGSLQNSVAEKRENVNFTDSIFAEDIGKFPDLNLAESLQRIPGVQIQRDVTGEGVSVAVRGLGRDFTQITLNGARIETASDSNIDAVSQGRGLDLPLFPTELFRQLTVSKTPSASQVEGAVAANIDLRVARPFDKKGFHFNYVAKGTYQEAAEELSPRLGLYASNTWDTGMGEFGVLVGAAYSNRKYRSDGFNTFHLTTVGLGTRCLYPAAVNPAPGSDPLCNSFANPNNATGYGNSNQAWPTTAPAGYNFGTNQVDHDSNPATPDQLTVCGPGGTPGGTSGLSCRDLSFSLWPRLARPDTLVGERETTSGVVSLQWASPSEALSIYFDGLYSEADHPYERNDLNLAVRGISTNVPVDVTLNEDNVVVSATIANPIWLNENRPYHEVTDFINLNSGFEWQVAEKWKVDGSVNYNHSDWFRSTNTYLFNSNLNSGITAQLENNGDGVWSITPSRDLNDHTFWNWNALRIQPVQREVYQKGGRMAVQWGDERFSIKAGATQDYFHREVTNWDTTNCATSGGALGTPCGDRLAADGIQPATVGVPNAQLQNFLQNWTHGTLYNTSDFDVGLNSGWSLPNYGLLDEATNIRYFEQTLGVQMAGGTALAGWQPRYLTEESLGAYVEANGQIEAWGNLRYNAGIRYVNTEQSVAGNVTVPNLATPNQTDTIAEFQRNNSEYHKYLPSFNLASNLNEKTVLRFAASKTMTRPAPGDIAPNESLNVNADTLTRGNPNLAPYFAQQADIGLEWYFGDEGLGVVATNVWAKRLEGYTSIVGTDVTFGSLGIDPNTLAQAARDSLEARALAVSNGTSNDVNIAPVRVNQRQNTSEVIHLYGFELTYNQPLDFLLQGSGVAINYTRVTQYSTGGLPGAPSSAVVGLSPYTYNVTAFYENHGFSGRLSYAVRDTYISFLGNNDQNVAGDNWAQKSGYLDAQFSYKLPMEMDFSISLEVQNITNEQQLTFFRDDQYMPRTAFAPGRQMLLGVSGSF